MRATIIWHDGKMSKSNQLCARPGGVQGDFSGILTEWRFESDCAQMNFP